MTLPIPLEDGTTHINIYTRGQTTLGRWLSNLANVKVTINNVTFRSLENYWLGFQQSKKYQTFYLMAKHDSACNHLMCEVVFLCQGSKAMEKFASTIPW